jgi:hypothetical protein
MKWYRRLTSIALALVLVAGVSCTSDTTGIDEPTQETQSEPTVETSLLLGELLGDGLGDAVDGVLGLAGAILRPALAVTGLLSCSEQRYDVEYETIGPWGGRIVVGKHVLVIPRGALTGWVTIKGEQVPGITNSVRFSPEGLKFNKPATLTLSYDNCQDVDLPKAVIYATEDLELIDVLVSVDLTRWRKVTAPIDHFSRYALAY